ncbi:MULTISPECIES: hypothetical protein [Lysinibacillus]|uniref:hypothetical protein n=1 Tax=Lysinibacillus TaxID=400634 RepID=UPI00257CF306|nr:MULTISPECIES: hypothetical protein [Lysinibacillus]
MAKKKTIVDMEIVEIVARRIATGVYNPRTMERYLLSDVTNEDYRPHIINHLVEVYGWELDADGIPRESN